jgi:hypothetical protein
MGGRQSGRRRYLLLLTFQNGSSVTHGPFGTILLVEDDPKDVELTLTALDEYNLANEVVVATDGEQALDYLYYRGKFMRRAPRIPRFSSSI